MTVLMRSSSERISTAIQAAFEQVPPLGRRLQDADIRRTVPRSLGPGAQFRHREQMRIFAAQRDDEVPLNQTVQPISHVALDERAVNVRHVRIVGGRQILGQRNRFRRAWPQNSMGPVWLVSCHAVTRDSRRWPRAAARSYFRPLRIAAITRGLRRPWATATTHKGVLWDAYAMRYSPTERKRNGSGVKSGRRKPCSGNYVNSRNRSNISFTIRSAASGLSSAI